MRTCSPRRLLGVVATVLGMMLVVTAGADTRTLSVFAAASLADAFVDIARDFEQSHPGTKVQMNLAGSQQLATQIEQGAGADVFASADERWMDYAREHGLVRDSAQVFAHNRLAVIVPRTNPARINRLQDLAKPGVKLVMGVESVPVGKYGRELLRNLSNSGGFQPNYSKRVLANLASEEENVKSVVSKVQLGEADAGICYVSDVSPSASRYVRTLAVPEAANVIATYPIAVVAVSAHADLAGEFIERVLSADGQRALERHGLMSAQPPKP